MFCSGNKVKVPNLFRISKYSKAKNIIDFLKFSSATIPYKTMYTSMVKIQHHNTIKILVSIFASGWTILMPDVTEVERQKKGNNQSRFLNKLKSNDLAFADRWSLIAE